MKLAFALILAILVQNIVKIENCIPLRFGEIQQQEKKIYLKKWVEGKVVAYHRIDERNPKYEEWAKHLYDTTGPNDEVYLNYKRVVKTTPRTYIIRAGLDPTYNNFPEEV